MSSSASPQDQDSPPRAIGSSSSSNGAPPPANAGEKAAMAAAIEKTISCVSCRRRKLKCDRQKPKCSTCTRLKHDCEYPERRRNLGTKRRNMKELEARLGILEIPGRRNGMANKVIAEVETKLVNETTKTKTPLTEGINGGFSVEADWNDLSVDMNLKNVEMEIDFNDVQLPDYPLPEPSYNFLDPIPGGDFFSQEVISLGLQEPLPPDDMIDNLYFTLPTLSS